MNSKTHKVITATFSPECYHFAVPIDWNVDDIRVNWDTLYYKGKKQDVKSVFEESGGPYKPDIDEKLWDLEVYFDCEEDCDCEDEMPLCFRKNGSKCKLCDNLCVDEEDSVCHECYHKSEGAEECYCDEEENIAWLKKQNKTI